MQFGRLPAICSVASSLLAPAALVAQSPSVPGQDGAWVLVLEHTFTGGAADSVVVRLDKHVFYLAELSGPAATPVIAPIRRYGFPAVVASRGRKGTEPELFEVHTGWSGPHTIRLTNVAPDGPVRVRLYRDEYATERAAESHDRSFAAGLSFGGGMHAGYRLDPTGGADPAGGGDVEGCILAQSGGVLDACIGLARQAMPDAGFSITWYFIEPRVKLLSRRWLGERRTDLLATGRIAQAGESGPRNLTPSLLGLGLQVTQHLDGGARRGWSLYLAFLDGRLGNVPETELRDSDRLTAGFAWVP